MKLRNVRLTPPAMPEVICVEMPPRPVQDSVQEHCEIKVCDLTHQEAAEFGEFMKETFILHHHNLLMSKLSQNGSHDSCTPEIYMTNTHNNLTMNKAKENQMKKSSFEILFKDSPEYFLVENAKMIQEGNLLRFICFDEKDKFKEDIWYPMIQIYRVKRYCI